MNTEDLKYFSLFQSPEENKLEYRRLAKQLHPDKNKGNKAKEKKLVEVNLEYETVKKFQAEYGQLTGNAKTERKFDIKARREQRADKQSKKPKEPVIKEQEIDKLYEKLKAFGKIFGFIK